MNLNPKSETDLMGAVTSMNLQRMLFILAGNIS